MILTFEDHEENMIDWIVSCLGIGVKSFQIQNTKTEKLKFRDLRIDFSCRKVIKNNRQEWGCEITLSTEKEDFSFKMNERSSFMLKLTCDENFNYKL